MNGQNLIILTVCLANLAAVASGAHADADAKPGLTLEWRGSSTLHELPQRVGLMSVRMWKDHN